VDEIERSGTDGSTEQDNPMAFGTKTFMVAAFMAIAALFGSIGASNADTLHPTDLPRHID
jgi:hypothetical protein